MVHDQLRGHHGVDLRWVAALLGNRITQTRQIDQSGLPQDVMAHHACGVPGKVQITLALNQLLQGIGQQLRRAAAHQIFSQHPAGVRQTVIGVGL
ncbi:hypothetical protein D3C72_2211080 [compost metagenome]